MSEEREPDYTLGELADLIGTNVDLAGKINVLQQVATGREKRTPEEIIRLKTAVAILSGGTIDPDRLGPEFEADPAPEDTRR